MIPVLSQEDSGMVRLRRLGDDFDVRQARAKATFLKSEILDREFLYGVDIQNSSLGEGQDLLPAMTLGHFKARFQIAADRLLLVAETSHLFISKINHPERLIYEWTILSSDADHVTIAIDRPSPILTTLVAGPEASRERNSWLRSAEFVKEDNLLLLQTSLETQKGEVIEFLESVFPREALVTEERRNDVTLGAPLYMNEELEPLSTRFGFLSSVLVYFDGEKDSRIGSMVANRFAWSASGSEKPIEWHVTRNLPDDLLPVIRTGVEGWNRYSQKMWGKDLLRFAGRLPEGIHLGDPRYNVIYWDTVNEAGAAYETQSADPETGLQSHSLIYLPRSWIRMGEEAHRKSFPSEIRSSERTLFGQKIRARCQRHASDRPHVMKESLEGISPEVFGRELLKQTLLHEVGHALGMDHNFKGSLAFDPDAADSMPTHSVMDYNDFFVERSVFDSVDSADGPILEYDRQILSALYNRAEDISSSDPVLPTCNDAEADLLVIDGHTAADPLCNRYDLGKDPAATLVRALQLLSEPASRMGPVVSLPTALDRYRSQIAPRLAELLSTKPDALQSRGEVLAVLQQSWSTVTKLQSQYLSSGHESLFGHLRALRKSLLPYREAPANESGFRAKVMSTMSYAALLLELPQQAKASRELLAQVLQHWAAQTPWALGQENPTEAAAALAHEAIPALDFSKLRESTLALLALPSGTSLHYAKTETEELDLELWAITILATSAIDAREPAPVRRSAVAALATYAATDTGTKWIIEVRKTLQQQLTQARSSRQREELRHMLALLRVSS